jgi:hypothetical protein
MGEVEIVLPNFTLVKYGAANLTFADSFATLISVLEQTGQPTDFTLWVSRSSSATPPYQLRPGDILGSFPDLRLVMQNSAPPATIVITFQTEYNPRALSVQATAENTLDLFLGALQGSIPLAVGFSFRGAVLDLGLKIGEIGVAAGEVILVREAKTARFLLPKEDEVRVIEIPLGIPDLGSLFRLLEGEGWNIATEILTVDGAPVEDIATIYDSDDVFEFGKPLFTAVVRVEDGSEMEKEVDPDGTVGQFLCDFPEGLLLFAGERQAEHEETLGSLREETPWSLRREYEFAFRTAQGTVVRAFTPDTRLVSAIAEVTGAPAETFVATYGSSTLDPSAPLSAIQYRGGTIVLRQSLAITFRVNGEEVVETVGEDATVSDVKAQLADDVPDLGSEIDFVTPAGRLSDSENFLEKVDQDETVEVLEKPRRFRFKSASSGEEHAKVFDRDATVADAIGFLSKRYKGRPFKLFLTSQDEPLDPSLALSEAVPRGTVINYVEEKLSYSITFQGQNIMVAIEPHVTFKDLKLTLLPVLLPDQTVDESQYGFFIKDREVSDQKEGSPIPGVAKGENELELRVRDARYVFSYTKNGKPKRKPLRIPEETTIANLYEYWMRRLKMHVTLRIPAGKINRRATARLKDCPFGDLVIEVHTKELKYFFKLPGIEGLVKLRLSQDETVKDFKARLTVGQTVPIEINGQGEPIRGNRVKVVYQGQVLKNGVKFVDLEVDEDPTRFCEVDFTDARFLVELGGEQVQIRLPPNLPIEEAERRISQELGQTVYLAPEFRTEPYLRETNRILELLTAAEATASLAAPLEPAEPVAELAALIVNYDKLRQVVQLEENDASVTILFEDSETRDRWSILFIRDGRHPALPPSLVSLTSLDHPAVLAVRRLTSPSQQAIPHYCIEYAIANLAGINVNGWDNTAVTIAIVGIVHGLRYLHYLGRVHGALSPANIFLNESLEPKLGPLGISDLSDLSAAPYIAPELRSGQPPDQAADVFSLAVVIYELVTNGQPVFPAGSIGEIAALQARRARPAFPDYIEPSIAAILRRALSPLAPERPTIYQIRDAILEIGCLPLTLEDVDGRIVVEYITKIAAWETQQGIFEE